MGSRSRQGKCAGARHAATGGRVARGRPRGDGRHVGVGGRHGGKPDDHGRTRRRILVHERAHRGVLLLFLLRRHAGQRRIHPHHPRHRGKRPDRLTAQRLRWLCARVAMHAGGAPPEHVPRRGQHSAPTVAASTVLGGRGRVEHASRRQLAPVSEVQVHVALVTHRRCHRGEQASKMLGVAGVYHACEDLQSQVLVRAVQRAKHRGHGVAESTHGGRGTKRRRVAADHACAAPQRRLERAARRVTASRDTGAVAVPLVETARQQRRPCSVAAAAPRGAGCLGRRRCRADLQGVHSQRARADGQRSRNHEHERRPRRRASVVTGAAARHNLRLESNNPRPQHARRVGGQGCEAHLQALASERRQQRRLEGHAKGRSRRHGHGDASANAVAKAGDANTRRQRHREQLQLPSHEPRRHVRPQHQQVARRLQQQAVALLQPRGGVQAVIRRGHSRSGQRRRGERGGGLQEVCAWIDTADTRGSAVAPPRYLQRVQLALPAALEAQQVRRRRVRAGSGGGAGHEHAVCACRHDAALVSPHAAHVHLGRDGALICVWNHTWPRRAHKL